MYYLDILIINEDHLPIDNDGKSAFKLLQTTLFDLIHKNIARQNIGIGFPQWSGNNIVNIPRLINQPDNCSNVRANNIGSIFRLFGQTNSSLVDVRFALLNSSVMENFAEFIKVNPIKTKDEQQLKIVCYTRNRQIERYLGDTNKKRVNTTNDHIRKRSIYINKISDLDICFLATQSRSNQNNFVLFIERKELHPDFKNSWKFNSYGLSGVQSESYVYEW